MTNTIQTILDEQKKEFEKIDMDVYEENYPEVCLDFLTSSHKQILKGIVEWAESEKEHMQKHSKGNYADGKIEAFRDLQDYLKANYITQ